MPDREEDPRRRLVEAALALLAIGLLIGLAAQALLPFLGAFLWATVLAVAGWPVAVRLRARFGLGPVQAAALASLLHVLLLLLPLVALSVALAEAGEEAFAAAERLMRSGPPEPPAFLARLPVVGERLAALWRQDLRDLPKLLADSEGALVTFGRIAAQQITDLVTVVAEVIYGILLAFQLLAAGPQVLALLRRLARVLGGEAGATALAVTTRAVRVVATGVLGGALVEALLTFLLLWSLGVPVAPLLALIGFALRLLQIGPWPVWLLGVAWLALVEGAPGHALLLVAAVIGITAVGTLLERRLLGPGPGVPKPILFVAVLGGLTAWGFTGMFLGAAAVSVAWMLMVEWVGPEAPPGGQAGARGAT